MSLCAGWIQFDTKRRCPPRRRPTFPHIALACARRAPSAARSTAPRAAVFA